MATMNHAQRLVLCLIGGVLCWAVAITAACQPNDTDTYRTCREARDAHAAPLHTHDPGYNTKLDRDGDGIACD